MKKIIFTLFMFCAIASFPQQVETLLTIPTEIAPGAELLCKTSSSFYMLRKTGYYSGEFIEDFYLRKYSLSTLKQVYDQKIKMPLRSKDNTRFKGILPLKSGLLLCASSYDHKHRVNSGYCHFINEEGILNPEGKEVHAAVVDGVNNHGIHYFSLSNDSTKLVVFFKDSEFKNKNTLVEVKVFDEQLKEVWTKKLDLPFPSKSSKIYDEPILDTEGNLYFIASVLPSKSTPLGKTEIVHYNSKTDELHYYPVTIDKKFILKFSLTLDKNGKLIYAGTYAAKKPRSKMLMGTTAPVPYLQGAFYFLIDPLKGSILKQEEKNLRELYPKERFNFAFYMLDHVVVLENGNTLLVCQFHMNAYIQDETHMSKGMDVKRASTQLFYNGNFIIIGFNDKQDPAWVKRIYKPREVSSPNYSPYTLTDNGINKVYVLYNDDYKNINTPANEPGSKSIDLDNSIPILISIEGNGTMQKQPLFKDTTPGSMWISPSFAFSPEKNQLILHSKDRGKDVQIQKLKINN